ncbi:MAG: PepSY domain-containing protein [Calditerrivibrio sp.]|nr:PepSY domain-containing protein [Calditerrivibrio sp.]
MKKFLVVTAIVTFIAGAVYAWGPQGYGPGYGMGPKFQNCYKGCGCGMMGGKGFGPGVATPSLSEADAKKAVESFMAANLKGFSIKDTQKFQVPRGTVYVFKVSDGKNTFELHVNPVGYVRGPFPIVAQ